MPAGFTAHTGEIEWQDATPMNIPTKLLDDKRRRQQAARQPIIYLCCTLGCNRMARYYQAAPDVLAGHWCRRHVPIEFLPAREGR